MEEKNTSNRISVRPLIGFGVLILLLAYIVEKELALPSTFVTAVAIVGGMTLLLTGLFYPVVPLYVLAAYIPFNRILPGDFGGAMTALNLTNILCIFALVGGLAGSSKGPKISNHSSLNIPILLFAFLGAISLFRGGSEYGIWYIWRFIIPLKRWLTPLLLYFLTLLIVKDRKTLKTVVAILMMSVTVVGLMAVKDYIDIGQVSDIEKARVGGIAEQPNMLAAFFSYYMFLLAAFYLYNPSKPKYWLLLIPFLVCFRGIQVTFSRGGYLSFFAGAFALAFFRSKRLFALMIVAILIAIMNPVLLPQGIVYRFMSTFQSIEMIDQEGDDLTLQEIATSAYDGEQVVLEGSSRQRLNIWKGAMRMIAEHPWWGTGYGSFGAFIPLYTPELKGKRIDAHNSYIIIAAEMGIPTLLVFLWILFLIIRKTHWLHRHAQDPFHRAMALGILAGLFGLLMANMFGSRLHSEEISGYFWILCALVVRAIAFEKAAEGVTVRAPSKRKVTPSGLVPATDLVMPKSLTATLRRFDELKYGEEQ